MAIHRTNVAQDRVVCVVANQAIGVVHKMMVVRVGNQRQLLAVEPSNHCPNAHTPRVVGKTFGLKPLSIREIPLSLSAGEDVLICNTEGHFEAGTTTPPTVRKN